MNGTFSDAVPLAMPQGALVAAIPVMVLSIISLAASTMLFLMQFYHNERWGYVTLMALAVNCSTMASIIQQFWYMTHWRHDRISEYQQAKLCVENSTLAIGPLTLGPSLVLFWVQMYCYNVLSALVLCWAIALVRGVYNCRHIGSIRFKEIVVPATKACSIILPIILVTIPFAPALEKRSVAALVITCTPMLCCWVVGSVCVVAILIKYVRGLATFTKIEHSRSTDISLSTQTGKSVKASQTDKWLLLRFIFTFVALSSFEILTINTAFTREESCKRLATKDSPDFSTAGTIGSVLTFVPGILVGFVGFLVFGTTSFFRRIYAEGLRDCCGKRKRSDTDGDGEDGRSWRTLGDNRGRVQTYHCRVESNGAGRLALVAVKREKGDGNGVVRELEPMQSPPTQSPGRQQTQPWKTLGIDCPN